MSNKIIHEDLKIHYVTEEIVTLTAKHPFKSENHTNQFAKMYRLVNSLVSYIEGYNPFSFWLIYQINDFNF